MTQYDHLAKVVHVIDAHELVINLGSNDGISIGDRFLIFGLGPEIFDPETNLSLGKLEEIRGKLEVTHTQDRVSTLRSAVTVNLTNGRKIYRKPNPNQSSLFALSYRLGSHEEIIEEPKTGLAEVDAKIGDFARKLS